MRRVALPLILLTMFGCAKPPEPPHVDAHAQEIAVVDEYLQALALLIKLPTAQDVQRAAPAVEKQRPRFEAAMVKLLDDNDPRAPSRLVFSQVVQIGAFIEADTPLGRATKKLCGDALPVTMAGEEKLYAPGDLYFWWIENRGEAYPLLEQWEQSPIAKESVIPMYRQLSRKPMDKPLPGMAAP